MENYNLIWTELLLTQILQEWRFESSQQVKNYNQLKYLRQREYDMKSERR